MSRPRPDPFALPEWQALHREASLVRQIIGAGATALGRASYGSGFGEYYTAFFGLSIGMERLAKLILVADHVLDNVGALPGPKVVRAYGHDLKKLCDKSDQVATRHNLSLSYGKPTEPICWRVVDCLASFADASKGRYANFESIGNPTFNPANEPVNKWWAEVVEPILTKHYRGRAAEQQVRRRANAMNALIGGSSLVLHTDESGGIMTDMATSSERSGQTKWAQKYGRFYTLSVVRWLADIFCELVHTAAYGSDIDALFGHNEFFSCYCVEDTFLLKRKIWPIG